MAFVRVSNRATEVDRVESYDIRIVRFAAAEFPALSIEASEIPRISRGWLHRVGVDRLFVYEILLSMLVILFECQKGFCQFSIERKKEKNTNGSLATTGCASQCLMAYGNAWSLAVKFCRVSVISRGYTQENDPSRYGALEKSCFGIMGYSINENTYILEWDWRHDATSSSSSYSSTSCEHAVSAYNGRTIRQVRLMAMESHQRKYIFKLQLGYTSSRENDRPDESPDDLIKYSAGDIRLLPGVKSQRRSGCRFERRFNILQAVRLD
ncbi:hypothetical protein V1478_002998 [Vespula squamosa]|uniref:Uncharacterized protein n=1 Tax=Vespula squamosa TaxID=30214 RepID=A0ABD2BRG1_VESSQ